MSRGRKGGLGRLLAAAMLASIAVTAPALAASEVSKPRKDVENVPGDYIQLDTLWVPVMGGGSKPIYLGLILRLWPGPDTRYEGCVEAPWIAEAMLLYFNEHPLEREQYDTVATLRKLVEKIITQHTGGKRLYRQVDILREPEMPDQDSQILTNTCR